MDFNDTPEEAAWREEVRAWLAANAPGFETGTMQLGEVRSDSGLAQAKEWQATKFEAGFAMITWPSELGGRGGTPMQQVIYNQEESHYSVPSYAFVIGLGMIGQMSAQAARRAGARVIASDLIPLRVELAAAHSADRAVDITKESLETVMREEAPDGADVVIDTTGISSIFGECLGLIRHEGRIAMQGYYPDPIEIDFHPTHIQRPTVTFPCGWDDQFNDQLAQDMADGGIAIDPLITHRFSAADAAEAYELVMAHPEESLGMVFSWAEM